MERTRQAPPTPHASITSAMHAGLHVSSLGLPNPMLTVPRWRGGWATSCSGRSRRRALVSASVRRCSTAADENTIVTSRAGIPGLSTHRRRDRSDPGTDLGLFTPRFVQQHAKINGWLGDDNHLRRFDRPPGLPTPHSGGDFSRPDHGSGEGIRLPASRSTRNRTTGAIYNIATLRDARALPPGQWNHRNP
jgi:hypothetical protein